MTQALSNIVQVTITTESRGVSRDGFGTALVVGYHNHWPELAREYDLATAEADLILDGFARHDPIVRTIRALTASSVQSPRVVVGRAQNEPAIILFLTVLEVVALGAEVYEFTITLADGTTHTISYTTVAGDTEDEIASALAAQLDNLSVDAVPSGGGITITPDNPESVFYLNGYSLDKFKFLDGSGPEEIEANLEAIREINDDWNTLILSDATSLDRIGDVAFWIEDIPGKLLMVTTHETDSGKSTGEDLMFLVQLFGLRQTIIIYSADQGAYAGAVWAGMQLPTDPGSTTWAYKELAGIVPDPISDEFADNIHAKDGNSYRTVSGLPVTQNATLSTGEFIDAVRGGDWLVTRLAERVFKLLAASPKVPFTNAGIDQVKAQVEAQMVEGVDAGYLSPEPPPEVTAPDLADVSKADRVNRLLPEVGFTATIAGAIHTTQIAGTLRI